MECDADTFRMLSRKVSFHVYSARQRYRWVRRDDLESAAWLGAAEALNAADPSRGFSSYVEFRIAGSVLDEIRRQSRYAARFCLFNDLPYDVRLYRHTPRRRDRILARADIEQILARAGLSDRQSKTLRLYYWEDLTTEQIAEIYGVCPSRVSQILSSAIDKIRRSLHVRAQDCTDAYTAA